MELVGRGVPAFDARQRASFSGKHHACSKIRFHAEPSSRPAGPQLVSPTREIRGSPIAASQGGRHAHCDQLLSNQKRICTVLKPSFADWLCRNSQSRLYPVRKQENKKNPVVIPHEIPAPAKLRSGLFRPGAAARYQASKSPTISSTRSLIVSSPTHRPRERSTSAIFCRRFCILRSAAVTVLSVRRRSTGLT